MEAAHDIWRLEERAVESIHQSIKEYAELILREYIEIRGCTPEAAFGVVSERLKKLGTVGIQDHLNRLYVEKVM